MGDIKLKQELKIYEPESTGAYGISVVDWDFLKNKVKQIKNENVVFMVMWSAFLGAGLSSLIYSLITDFPQTPDGSVSIVKAFSWSATIICFAISGVCFLFWQKISQAEQTKASYVLEHMEMIEARYKSISAEEEISEETEAKGSVIFSDNFERLDGWEKYLEGEIALSKEISPQYGDFCLKKDLKNDPHGGFKVTRKKFNLGFVFSGWIFRPSSAKGGKGDRIAIEDNSFNGYGFSLAHSGKYLVIERRESGLATEISGRVPFNPPTDKWYNFDFHSTPDGKFALHINDEQGNRLSAATAVDSKYTLFDRIVIHGGHPYYVDGLKIISTK